jgi:hypothetical protein
VIIPLKRVKYVFNYDYLKLFFVNLDCRQELADKFTFHDGQEARRSRRRTENVKLSPLVPPHTKTKVRIGFPGRSSHQDQGQDGEYVGVSSYRD